MRMNDDEILAFLLGLPDGFSCRHAIFFCLVVRGKNDAVSFFCISADGYRMILQFRVQHAFHGGVKVVHVAV